jgi:hypothetical protein
MTHGALLLLKRELPCECEPESLLASFLHSIGFKARHSADPEQKEKTMPFENDAFLSALLEVLGASRLLTQILERGFTLPIYGIAVDKLGSLMAVHVIESGDGMECRLVAAHLAPEGMVLPISIVYLDGTPGHVAYTAIETADQRSFTIQ